MVKVAVTGASGLIGQRTIELLKNDFQFMPLNKNQVDITKTTQTYEFIKKSDFDIFLHLAGYTDVNGAEKNKDQAYQINVRGTKNVFQPCQELSKKFIYISTDFVFDGKNPPYNENSLPNPLGYYAKSKYDGEKIVQGSAMIVRTSYPYGISMAPKPDFVRKIIAQLKAEKTLYMATDSMITPTFIDDFAQAMKYLLNNFKSEIYHLVGAESLSPFEAGQMIAKIFNFNSALIKPTTFAEYSKGKAQRSQFSVIKSIKNNFCQMRQFKEGLLEMKTANIFV